MRVCLGFIEKKAEHTCQIKVKHNKNPKTYCKSKVGNSHTRNNNETTKILYLRLLNILH